MFCGLLLGFDPAAVHQALAGLCASLCLVPPLSSILVSSFMAPLRPRGVSAPPSPLLPSRCVPARLPRPRPRAPVSLPTPPPPAPGPPRSAPPLSSRSASLTRSPPPPLRLASLAPAPHAASPLLLPHAPSPAGLAPPPTPPLPTPPPVPPPPTPHPRTIRRCSALARLRRRARRDYPVALPFSHRPRQVRDVGGADPTNQVARGIDCRLDAKVVQILPPVWYRCSPVREEKRVRSRSVSHRRRAGR